MATPGGSRNTEFCRYVKKECVPSLVRFFPNFKFVLLSLLSARQNGAMDTFALSTLQITKVNDLHVFFFRMALQKAFYGCHEINFLQTVFCVPIKQSLLNWVQPINCSCFCSFFLFDCSDASTYLVYVFHSLWLLLFRSSS